MSKTSFRGFPDHTRLVRIPEPFFQEILPFIDDINELKVTLYTLWYLERMEQTVKYIKKGDFLRDRIFMQSMGNEPENSLEIGLQKAVEHEVLLSAEIAGKSKEIIYLANTKRGRAIIHSLQSGAISLDTLENPAIQLDLLRPNIFEMYENNIGIITPMMAEILKNAEENYPAGWIEEAMELAVQNNSRRWKYVEAILRKWKENGRDGEY